MVSQSIKQIIIISLAGILSVLVVFFLANTLNLSFPLYVNQISTMKNDYFSVTSEGTAYAIPDVAIINVGYTTEGQTVEQVQTKANQVINKITEDLKSAGIKEEDIQTTNYNLNPSYDYTGGTQKITGYSANVNLEIKARDLEKGNEVIDIATKDGANQVGSISFEVDDIEKFQAEARKEAIEKAKIKAQEIANETGLTLGKIINVYESPIDTQPPYYSMARADALNTEKEISTELQPGQTEIKISVTLGYETR